MKKIAILVDGGFLSRIVRDTLKKQLSAEKIVSALSSLIKSDEELFRIYFYDAPPNDGNLKNPINNYKLTGKNPQYWAIYNFQQKLAEQENVALRLGTLAYRGWKLTDEAFKRIKEGIILDDKEVELAKEGKPIKFLRPHEVKPDFVQKAVDMRIGLDIAWISTRGIVDKIVLVAADNDFIPVMKFARKEGIRVAVAELLKINTHMKQHADEVLNLDTELFVD